MGVVELPIDVVLPEINDALRRVGAVVLLAPPGAGKTTRVPPAVLDAGLRGRLLCLQPRRVAARAAARRIASERGCEVGAEVGYRVRFESRVGPETRIELLTEGLLVRRLQADPFLEGVGCVVLDEFHERSLHADLALALLREIRRDVRPDLKLVVMSATLDPGPVAAWLDAPIVRASGRTWPVEMTYVPRPDDRPLSTRVAAAIRLALKAGEQGVLAFLPGVGEINRTAERLEGLSPEIRVLPLHGRLPAAAQDAALAATDGPKVVLATNVAETSVTVAGITAVVDAGLAHQPRYDPAVGLERLERVPISRASADQRAGRAGRLAPGRCHRMWTEADHRGRPAFEAPEVRRVDLTRAVLEIRGWGADPRDFEFFEAPPGAAVDRTEGLLRRLGAVDDAGLTALGRTLLALPVHPRLGRVVIAGHRAGVLHDAAAVAALTAERDIFHTPPEHSGDSDLQLRLDVLASGGRPPPGVNRGALAQARRARDQLVRAAEIALGRCPRREAEEETLLRSLLTAFPDRVARRRQPRSERFKLASGGGAILDRRSAVRDAEWILAVVLEGGRRGQRAEHVIRNACAIDPSWLETTTGRETEFDPEREAVSQRTLRRYLELVVESRPTTPDPASASEVLATAARERPTRAFNLDREAEALLARLRWLAQRRPDLKLPTFPELPGAAPGGEASEVLAAVCAGRRSFAETRRVALAPLLRGLLGHAHGAHLDALAPTHVGGPRGRRLRLRYGADHPPILEARIQHLLGLRETPKVAGAPVRLHLLAPNGRPAQITDDLEGFWRNTYADVRKQLRGRYPKHRWPEDPLGEE